MVAFRGPNPGLKVLRIDNPIPHNIHASLSSAIATNEDSMRSLYINTEAPLYETYTASSPHLEELTLSIPAYHILKHCVVIQILYNSRNCVKLTSIGDYQKAAKIPYP